MLFKRIVLNSLATFVLSTTVVMAQPSGAEGDDFIYRVQAGDTLSNIAELYTTNSVNWQRLQTLNNVADPYALPIGQSLRIPFSMIPMSTAKTVVTHQKGSPKINGRSVTTGYEIKEGDVISTDASSFITLALVDESTISVPPHSLLTIQRSQAFDRAGITDSILKLDQGNVETRVAPKNQGVGRFEVRTPIAITGVRGTDLRVGAHSDKTITEVISGRAKFQTASSGFNSEMVTANRGAAIDSTGTLLTNTTLLAAPLLSEPTRNSGTWTVEFPPITGAERYLTQISLDELGTQLVSREFTTDTTVQLRSSSSATHYVHIRAVDANGIMGLDAVKSFPGQASLQSSDGAPVLTRFDIPVNLRSF